MVRLFKLSGAGNTFLLLDLRNESESQLFKELGNKNRAALVRMLCDPYHSIGADGFVFLKTSERADLEWDFYNADGSKAKMCGNAARCVGCYLVHHPRDAKSAAQTTAQIQLPISYTLHTGAGVITVSIPEQKKANLPAALTQQWLVEVEMPQIQEYKSNNSVRVGAHNYSYDVINSGVPHVVFPLKKSHFGTATIRKNVDKLVYIVDKVRSLARFKRDGVNVTFYSVRSRNAIDSLTFERGVTGYTQACGTGAVAAALSYAASAEKIIAVSVPGGDLTVDFTNKRPHLLGPAVLIAEIHL